VYGGELPLWHLGLESLWLGIVAKELVVQEPANTLFIDSKRLHSKLHSIE